MKKLKSNLLAPEWLMILCSFRQVPNCALNKHQAINVIKHIAQRYEIYEV